MAQQRPWQLLHTLTLAAVVLALVLLTILPWPLVANDPQSRVLTWWVIVGLILISLVTLGYGIVGRPLGLLVDDRNRMSLSRLQMGAWTVLVLSGFYTIILWNLRVPGNTDPLKIAIPQELWWLLGISTTSLVGSPIIRGTKKDTPAAEEDFARKKALLIRRRGPKFQQAAKAALQATALGAGVAVELNPAAVASTIDAEGQEVQFESSEMASPGDLFGGEETGNLHVLDMGKVQMFYFTVILILVYTTALLNVLASKDMSVSFPAVNESMVALLGISHAGYLGYKAASHSPTPPEAPQP